MTHSPLTNGIIHAAPGNYGSRDGRAITRITPHHMAGVLPADACARLFQQPGRYASANYCIGPDGTIVCSVDEDCRAYTSSSYDNDTRAVTVEISNDGGPGWHVSDAAFSAFVALAADVCRRHGIPRLVKGETLTWHSMFAATACPGDYLLGRMGGLEAAINAAIPIDASQRKDDSYLCYRAHVQGIGTQHWVVDGLDAGTTGQGLRLEAVAIDTGRLTIPGELRLGVQLHLAGKGWVDYGEAHGQLMGTTGESRAVEAVSFYVIGNTTGKRVMFQVHQEGYGWGGVMEATDRGTPAGSTGQGRRLEAFRLWLA
jgi:hypothetical protein